MKIVLHKTYGSYGCTATEEIDRILRKYEYKRSNEELIKAVEKYKGKEQEIDYHEIIEIPDDATDFCVCDYDGYESVVYVMDGKLYSDAESTGNGRIIL